MKAVFAVLFFLLLPGLMLAQSQTDNRWKIQREPNELDMASAAYGTCHVHFQHNGEIRLNAYDKNVKGFKGGLYHDVTLSPGGNTMIVSSQHWTPDLYAERAKTGGSYKGPDLFWQTCGKALTTLPPDLLKRFSGYHGLPQ